METQAQSLYDQALKLSLPAREDLAVRLLGSVAPPAAEAEEIKQAWVEEIDRRVAKFESGESTAIPIEDVWPKIAGRPWGANATDNG